MKDIAQQTLAEIVTHNHEAALLLEKYELDFCCKGKRTLADACREKDLSTEKIAEELNQIAEGINPHQMPFNEMTTEQLIGHILIHHHFYVKQTMPQISNHLEKVAIKHGDRFPWMRDVYHVFSTVREEMTHHMQKEEMILFPVIRNAENFSKNKDAAAENRFIPGAISVMESEHDAAGELMLSIRKLTNNYQEPEGACTTFKVSLAELKAFEEDLHQHVHLENNILFPMAKKFIE
jgi:regulator of cell morphogenesis and NO signaling